MSEVMYYATKETLASAVEQVPHVPSRPKLARVAKSFVDRTNCWEVISAWWYPKARYLSQYPLQDRTALSRERAIDLNRFVTNGVSVRSGEYKAIQLTRLSAETFSQRYISVPENRGAKQILRGAIENAVRVRADQVFHDGNHRTALLLLYEILAEHKLLLQAKPMSLYIIISNRSDVSEHGQYAWEQVVELMYRHCKSRLKFLSTIPTSEERPALFADAVTTLQFENSAVNQLAVEWFTAETKNSYEDRRNVARRFKTLDRGLYKQFYRLCVAGSWEGPPRAQIYKERCSA